MLNRNPDRKSWEAYVKAKDEATVLIVLLKSYDLVSAAIRGIAEPTFLPTNEHADGIRDLYRSTNTAFQCLSEFNLLRLRVLAGIGDKPTVPALFWSSPHAFYQAAINIAAFHNCTPDHKDYNAFIQEVLDETAMFRYDLQEAGLFVGWVPFDFKSKYAPDHAANRLYKRCWSHLDQTATFYCLDWSHDILFYVERDEGYEADLAELEGVATEAEDDIAPDGSFVDYVPDGNVWRPVRRPRGSPVGPPTYSLAPSTAPPGAFRRLMGRRRR